MKVIKKCSSRPDGAGSTGGADGGRGFEAGPERRRNMMLFGFAGIAAIVGLIFAAVVLVSVALQP